ncbi:hypothetical protein HG530_009587 [Fusarium avenaceum]|nr:hypothetical protein HG530_009587 [Fusarium avenaceum]
MSKALGLAVAIVVVKALVLLGTIVPCQLEKTLPVACILILPLGERLITRIAKEVKVEASSAILNVISGNNLNPVTIRVKHKGNVSHAAVTELLLELVTSILDSLAGSLDVVHRNTGVAKAAIGLLVPVVDLVLRIILGTIVVGQLDKSLSVKGTLVV